MDQHHVEYITEEASAVRTRRTAAKTRKCLQLADLSVFFPSPSPRLLGPLMSKSMCGCGCSIISSLMKRLGCAVCCSDLFSSHTSEQLQRLAAGCPPQPKVTPTRSHLCPFLNRLCVTIPGNLRSCAVQETFGLILGTATCSTQFCLLYLLCNSMVHVKSHPIPECKIISWLSK